MERDLVVHSYLLIRSISIHALRMERDKTCTPLAAKL